MPLTTDEQQTPVTQAPPSVEQRPPFLQRPRVRKAIAALIASASVITLAVLVVYLKIGSVIDKELAGGPFADTMDIFSASKRIAEGDAITAAQLIAELHHRGYKPTPNQNVGFYSVNARGISVTPGPQAHSAFEPCLVEFSGAKIARIVAQSGRNLREIALEPTLITNVSDKRERRRIVTFKDIPPRLVHAVISVEDKKFFEHGGFDLPRMVKAAYVDMKTGRKDQGASTLSMQLVRNFWLEPEKSWKRKLQEVLLTMHIEHRLTKQQIFEYYANQIYLGRSDTFSINGFAEASRAYFGKEISQLTDSDAALLAGMVQRPSYYNPIRYPERATERRNVVLNLMHRNGYLSAPAFNAALAAPLDLHPHALAAEQSPFFVDLVKEEVESKLDGAERAGRHVYTSLDPDLQAAAETAVREGMANVDRQLRSRRAAPPSGQPQVALIALDPRTGEVKALVGGRDYRISQLNHVTAMRQPGSAFKPFVYAAAINTAIEGGARLYTPASIVSDEPITFRSGGQDYQPHNFHGESHGAVTLRYALAHSLNIASVNLAAGVGFGRVAQMAHRLGLTGNIGATPAVALGAYEATPLEIAGAYTAFANEGMQAHAAMVSEVQASDGRVLYTHSAETKSVLDPRVAYVMLNLMQEVLRSGTGAGARAMGFTQPAAGKTGTSRDGWFAGFTTELLCVVWVGFDDNRDLNLEGARSALPIWTEFMMRASKIAPYTNAQQFRVPAGIRNVEVCAESGDLAGAYCPDPHTDIFIAGTEPMKQCSLHTPQAPLAISLGDIPEFRVPPPSGRDR